MPTPPSPRRGFMLAQGDRVNSYRMKRRTAPMQSFGSRPRTGADNDMSGSSGPQGRDRSGPRSGHKRRRQALSGRVQQRDTQQLVALSTPVRSSASSVSSSSLAVSVPVFSAISASNPQKMFYRRRENSVSRIEDARYGSVRTVYGKRPAAGTGRSTSYVLRPWLAARRYRQSCTKHRG